MKTCSCGRHHDAAAWRGLPFVGVQAMGGERVELRNCQCRSTIAVELGPDESVCIGCGARLDAELKVCGEADGVFCPACAFACGLVGMIRRSAA